MQIFKKILGKKTNEKNNVDPKDRKTFNLLVEWTRGCNISCHFCPIHEPTMRAAGQMDLELWEKILLDCKDNGHYVNWVHHLGDPLIWEHFERGMRMWKESGLSQRGHISTNGIPLTRDKVKIIRETGLDFIRICIDTLRPDVYEKLRNNKHHSVIVENIQLMLDEAPDVDVQLQLMRTKLNEDEDAGEYYKFFGRDKNFKVFYTTVMDLGKEHGLGIISGEGPSPALCPKVDYEHCIIGWDGTVGLCCADYWLENKLGNINDMTISEVFDGEYANKVRRMIKAGNFSLAPACVNCSMDHMKPQIRKLV